MRKHSDRVIKQRIEEYYETELMNLGEDRLADILDDDEDDYDRATVLLRQSSIRMHWS